MPDQKSSPNPSPADGGEQAYFWRHMAFRLFLGCWALHTVIYDAAGKAFVTLLVLACFKGMGETIFASLAVYARLKAKAEEARRRQEELEQAREAKKAEQAAAAEKYFDFGKDRGSFADPARPQG